MADHEEPPDESGAITALVGTVLGERYQRDPQLRSTALVATVRASV